MKYDRIWNFNAGPAAVPVEVLERTHNTWFNYRKSGMSVLEMSHRSKAFDEIHNETIELVKRLLRLGNDFHVLFLQGGASLQFAMVPMNFIDENHGCDYIHTGVWSGKAIKEAKQFGRVHIAFDGSAVGFNRLPTQKELSLTHNAAYVHITSNNTIYGTQYRSFPEMNGQPLVADMSSDIFSRRFDPRPFGLIYAGAQKNIGPSGVTLVIIRKSFYEKCIHKNLTSMLHYKTHVDKNSLYNTPNTFGIYFMREVLLWIEMMGGIEAMEKRNMEKAKLLYSFLDQNRDYYRCTVDSKSRSQMNVCFNLPTEQLNQAFIDEGLKAGFHGLKGHKNIGGCRVSMYNATPTEAIAALVDFMEKFMATNG